MHLLIRLVLVAGLFVGLSRHSQADVIVNGGLELNAEDNFISVPSSNSYAGWNSVGSGDVEFIRQFSNPSNVGPAAEGNGFVDLNGATFQGGISQTLSTLTGVLYQIEFFMSGNPGVSGEKLFDKTMEVFWNGESQGIFTFEHVSGDTQQSFRWEEHSLTLQAIGSDVLSFVSTTNDIDAGPLLDGITVTAVPEPTTMVLFGSSILFLSGYRRRSIKFRRQPANTE